MAVRVPYNVCQARPNLSWVQCASLFHCRRNLLPLASCIASSCLLPAEPFAYCLLPAEHLAHYLLPAEPFAHCFLPAEPAATIELAASWLCCACCLAAPASRVAAPVSEQTNKGRAAGQSRNGQLGLLGSSAASSSQPPTAPQALLSVSVCFTPLPGHTDSRTADYLFINTHPPQASSG